MPNTKSAANPFFGNIRQNMDLIGGVGRQPIARPNNITKQAEADMPSWLQKAVDEKDEGKTVSEKFLKIEKKEQKRMQKALQCNVTYGSPNPDDCNDGLQLAGIEKGSKNRYNNIWPYEHTRVKLQGVPHGSCDYINANHVKSSRSHKHYIATQGPIPATFNVRSFPLSPLIIANSSIGLLECRMAARCPCYRYAHCRERRQPDQSTQLLGR